MENDDQKLDVNLNEVWRTCRKLQAAIFRHGFNINHEFARNDPKGHGLISESKFTSVLMKYKKIIGLSEFEIRELTDYFRIRDGRIAYKQFCGVLCEKGQEHSQNLDTADGLEWNDPMHVNILNDQEKRQLCILLMKIAKTCIIPLFPYFQDYEVVTRNSGTVTVAHFSRVLHFMKLSLSEKDFMLLIKRYMKDSYTVNYVAFVKHIDAIIKYLKEQGLMDQSNNLVSFPGQLIDLELPELPIPNAEGINKYTTTFEIPHKSDNAICDTIFTIQNYVYENGIRISEFMEPFDVLKSGSITRNQFVRALDCVGISESKRLRLGEREFESIFSTYADPIDFSRVKWKHFCDEIDKVFTEKHLDKQPRLPVGEPLKYIKTLPKPGQHNWKDQSETIRDLCEETIKRIQIKINTRRIYLHPFFKNFDKLNKGYVRPSQAFQALLSNTILISEEEFAALEKRYCNDMGFNYMRFLEDIDPTEYAFPKLKEPLPIREVHEPEKPCLIKAKPTEQDVIQALSKIKRQMSINNVKIIDFFVDYDHHRENQIPESDFRRGLDNADVKLTVPEVDIICDIFRSSNRGCSVRYRDFCNTLDEIFIQESSVQDNELSAPLKHFPCVDCVQCFLNFEERTSASRALQKLATKPDQISNLQSLFKDFDKENCGTITQNQFLRALTVRDMNNLISRNEFEVVCKCFGYERGLRIEFDYRAFLNIINILHETGQVKRHV
ncbi:uncharacterized protein LOC129940841 isoform X2 [Eupeodes corollae]|uniref:uncharacterized protein LOC129940841 isoform X2 n=1 Tax=Eupeodes corollae TaxID=290404 RepID=UPI002490F1E7|nr:uncharacterized protein LOC129940841 isoform X2 [Eupeodes corollae]